MDNNINGVLSSALLSNMLDTQQILATGSLMDQPHQLSNSNLQSMDTNAMNNANSSEYNDENEGDNLNDNNTNDDDNNDSNSNNNMIDEGSNGQMNSDMLGTNQSQKRQASDYDSSGNTPNQMSQKKRQKTNNFNNYNNSGNFNNNKNMSGKVELRILLPSKVFLIKLYF